MAKFVLSTSVVRRYRVCLDSHGPKELDKDTVTYWMVTALS